MQNIKFYIPTRDRAKRQRTILNLHPFILKRTYLVCDADQYLNHLVYCSDIIPQERIIKFPPNTGNFITNNYGCAWDKKQWIYENTDAKYIIFMDDDLSFSYRNNNKLIKANTFQSFRGLNKLYLLLNKHNFIHVALSPIEGNNRVKENYLDNNRAYRVMGFNVDKLRQLNIKMNRIRLMSDFDITLQLLEFGHPNRIVYNYANGHRKSNDSGGCSIYRSPQTMKDAAKKLHDLHPNYVKIETKRTSKPWNGFNTNERTDVRIYWKKAYQFGIKKIKKSNIKKFI